MTAREAVEPASEFLVCLDPKFLLRVVTGDEISLTKAGNCQPEGQDCSTVIFHLVLYQVS